MNAVKMKHLPFLLLIVFSSIVQLNAQTAVSRLPPEMFNNNNTAMNVGQAKPKKKPKSLGEHALKVEDSRKPEVENAITLLNSGKVEEAASAFDKFDETDTEAAFGLAAAHYMEGELPEALAELAKLPQDDPDVQYLKGLVLTDQGNYDEAEDLFMHLIESDPHDLDSWDALGYLYFSAGLDEPAEECRKAILEMDPNYEMSY